MTVTPGARIHPDVDAFLTWVQVRHGGDVALAEPATSRDEGFDSAIHLIQLRGSSLPDTWRRPLVLRIKSEADRHEEAEREATIQGWVADHGYPAPRVLAVTAPGEMLDRPAQVMERAPGMVMIDAIRRAPWRTRRHARALGTLHARLHALAPDGFPAGDDLLDRRLALTRRTSDALDHEGLQAGLDAVEKIAARLRDAPGVVCHGDFHPLNVLVSDGGASVIDWTDAGVGDRHGDVARTLALFDVAAIAADNPVERAVLRLAGPRLGRVYRRAYEAALPLDEARIRLWRSVHLLHGWSQAVALHAGLFAREGPDDRHERVPPAMVDELRRLFGEALASGT